MVAVAEPRMVETIKRMTMVVNGLSDIVLNTIDPGDHCDELMTQTLDLVGRLKPERSTLKPVRRGGKIVGYESDADVDEELMEMLSRGSIEATPQNIARAWKTPYSKAHEHMRYTFWLADGAVYSVEDGQPILYLTRREYNPIFNNILKGHVHTVPYGLSPAEIRRLQHGVSKGRVLRVNLNDLGLLTELVGRGEPEARGVHITRRGEQIDSAYFVFDTRNPDLLNPEQRRVVEWLYCDGEDIYRRAERIKGIMEAHNEHHEPTLQISFKNPNHTLRRYREGDAVAYPCWRYSGNGARYSFTAGVTIPGSSGIIINATPKDQEFLLKKQEENIAAASRHMNPITLVDN